MLSQAYTPRTWRTHALHIVPQEPFDPQDSGNKRVLDWIFLISALNFSFWSEYDNEESRYGVLWRDGWESRKLVVWTGYWSLVAALNRGVYGLPQKIYVNVSFSSFLFS